MSEEQVKVRAQRRPETRMRDAMKIAGALSMAQVEACLAADPVAEYGQVKYEDAREQAERLVSTGRAMRDFCAEIAHLDQVQRSMVLAGLKAARSNGGAA